MLYAPGSVSPVALLLAEAALHSASQPVGLQPRLLGRQGVAAIGERSQKLAAHRRKIGPPASVLVGLDMGRTADGGAAQRGEVDLFPVDAGQRRKA